MSLTVKNPTPEDYRKLFAVSPATEVSRKLADRAEGIAAQLLPNGKRKGDKWVCGNVRGDEGDSLEVTLTGEYAGRWTDWATSESGDLLDLVKETRGLDTAEAIKEANSMVGNPTPPPKQRTAPKNNSVNNMKEVHTWHYPEKDGIKGRTVRKESGEMKNGKLDKDIIPYFHTEPKKAGVKAGYTIPLYGRTGKYVFIVEGEKCVDAMLQMGFNAVTCQGSQGGVEKSDWSMLDDTESVCFLPDNDEAGDNFAEAVAEVLNERKPERILKVLRLDGLKHGGDIVDWVQFRAEGWDGYANDKLVPPLGSEFKLLAQHAEIYVPEPEESMFVRANEIGLEAIDWLVEDFVENETVTWLYGESQAFKTFVCLNLGCAVAGGKAWGPRKRCKKGKVLYVCGEGHKGIRRRLEAWSRHTGLSIPNNLYISKTSTNLADPKIVEKLVKELQRMGDIAMVIVDTFARNYGGEENSNDAIGHFYHVAEHYIVKPFNCTVLITHHPGKNLAAGARGAASIKQNSDAMYKVERCDSGNHWLTKLECEKMKDAELAPDALFEALRLEIGIADKYGKEMTSLALQHVDTHEQKKMKQRERDNRAEEDASARLSLLAEIHKDGSLIQKDYAARAGIDQSVVSRHMNKLREQGFIKGGRPSITVTSVGRKMLSTAPAYGAE